MNAQDFSSSHRDAFCDQLFSFFQLSAVGQRHRMPVLLQQACSGLAATGRTDDQNFRHFTSPPAADR